MSRCRIHKDFYERTLLCDQISSFAGRVGHHKFMSRIHAFFLTNSKVTRRESSGTTPRLDLPLDVLFSKQRGRYGAEIKIDSLENNLGSSKAGVLNGMLRSFLSIAPSRCESHWGQVDLLRLYSKLCDKALHHPVNKMMRTFPSTSESGNSHHILARPSTRATWYQKMTN